MITVSPLCTLLNLLPLPVKLEIAVTSLSADKYIVEERMEVGREKAFYEFGSKDEVALRIQFRGFNYSAFLNVSGAAVEERLVFVDHRGLETAVRSRVVKSRKRRRIYVFAETVLINESPYKLFLFSQGQLLAGQRIRNIPESESKYVFLGDAREPAVGFSEDDPSQVRRFDPNELGQQVVAVPHHDQLFELVVNHSLHCLDEQAQIFTSTLKLLPRFVIVNRTTRQLALRQTATDQRLLIRPQEARDWFWYSREAAKTLCLSPVDPQLEQPLPWDYSAALALETAEETVMVVRPKGSSEQRLLLKVEIFKEDLQTFLVVRELRGPEDSLVVIRNNLKLVQLKAMQLCLLNGEQLWSNYRHFAIPPMQEVDFGWDQPTQPHSIRLHFNFVGPYRSKFTADSTDLHLDASPRTQLVQFRSEDDELLEIEILFEVVGLRRKITVQSRDESAQSRMNEEEVGDGNKVGVSLAEIGISVIGGRQPRSEIVFISVKKVQAIMMEKPGKRNLEVKVKYVNIDNNLNHNTIYPVLFTPLK